MAEDTASTAAAATAATAAGSDAASKKTADTTADKGAAAAATATTATTDASKAAATVLEDKAGASGDAAAAAAQKDSTGAYPADWRERAAKGKDGKVDDKRLARLQRYASPEALAEALINAQDRIAKGDLAKVLGANPSAEDIAEYRLANGIPDKPDGYKVELPGGRVIGEADKPLVGKFLDSMHKAHAPPALVNQALSAYYEMQDEQMRQREDADADAKVSTEEALRQEYGVEYRPNLNAVRGLLAQFPSEAGEKLLAARFGDGSLVFNDPAIVRAFVHLARELNPAATIAPGSTGSAGQTVADELQTLKADMANPDSDYHKAPKVEKVVGGKKIKDTPKAIRYLELQMAQERLNARAA